MHIDEENVMKRNLPVKIALRQAELAKDMRSSCRLTLMTVETKLMGSL